MGADAGTFATSVLPTERTLVSYGDSYDSGHPNFTYSVDGVRVPVEESPKLGRSGLGLLIGGPDDPFFPADWHPDLVRWLVERGHKLTRDNGLELGREWLFELASTQEPWVYNWGIHEFSEEEKKRLRQAFERVKSERCRRWFEATINALGERDLRVESTRPKTMDKLLEYAEFNKYDPKLTAQDMRISQESRDKIAAVTEKRLTNLNVANAVTLGPDFTRIYLMDSAFWQDSGFFNWSGRDLSGIIAFELLHVAGFGDDKIWKYRSELQKHCGDPSDNL